MQYVVSLTPIRPSHGSSAVLSAFGSNLMCLAAAASTDYKMTRSWNGRSHSLKKNMYHCLYTAQK